LPYNILVLVVLARRWVEAHQREKKNEPLEMPQKNKMIATEIKVAADFRTSAPLHHKGRT
ncbi:MAG: hypothetical protein ABFE02_01260, partial [Sulfuricella sp.]